MMVLAEIIVAEFAFLVNRGFEPTIEGPNEVRFDGPSDVFVRVFRDTNDMYVGFRIGLTSRPRDALTATEFARICGVPATNGEFPDTADELRSSVGVIARQLQEYGERPLSGDNSIYDEAMELRREYTRKYTKQAE